MATIGSIGIAFDAETSGLLSGVDDAVSSLASVKKAVEELRSQLSGLSSLSVSLSVDTASIDDAKKSVESLKTTAASASAEVSVAADTSAVSEAADEVAGLGEAVSAVREVASGARSSLGGLAVSAAIVVTSARQAIKAYADFRDGFIEFVTSTTGARTAVGALRTTLRGLYGDTDALRAVFGGLKAGLDEMVSGFLSASNINSVLQGTLGGVLRLFGATDEAVIAATQTIADLITRQIALASSHRLVQRSLQAIDGAYGKAADALAEFLTGTSTGRAVADGLAKSLVFVAKASMQIDSTIARAVSAVQSYITSAGLMARVSAAAGTAFDEVAAAMRGLLGGTSTLGEAFTAVQLRLGLLFEGLVRLLPSFDDVAKGVGSTVSAMARLTPQALGLAGALAKVFDVYSLVAVAAGKNVGLFDFGKAVTKTAALSVAFGGLSGAVGGAVAGTGAFAGAVAGATGALAALGSTLPVAAAGAIAAAVATGRFADELARLASQAGQIGDISDRFGQPVQEIEKLKTAADNTNTAFAAVIRGQQTFASNLEKVKVGQLGTPQAREAAAAFSRLGITVEDLRSKNQETIFLDVAKAVSAIPDATKRTQVAMDLFGRTGPALMPLLKNIEAINADMERLGGTIEDADFERLTSLDRSFQKVDTASKSLSRTLLIPFTRMQQAVNNLSAEVSGGLVKALTPVVQVLADISTPIAVIVEIAARMANVLLRVVGIFAELLTALGVFSTVAVIFEGIRIGFESAMAPVEALITGIETVAKAITGFIAPAVSGIGLIGQALGLVIGAIGQLVTYVALGAAAWGIYSAAVAVATGFSITATVSFIAMWAAALGPFALIIGGLAAIGAGITLLIGGISSLVSWMFDWGDSASQIDGATASVDELANAVAEAESSSIKNGIEEGMLAAGAAASDAADKVGETIGLSQEQVDALKASIGSTVAAAAGLVGIDLNAEVDNSGFERARESIANARGEMAEFSIRAAQLGQAGAEAIAASSEEFNELQRKLADGKIGLDEFDEGYDAIQGRLKKTLESIEEGSPEQTLQRNLEVFKQLDDAAKQVAKSVRDIGAGVQIGDKFFPRSAEVKARAQEYADQYTDALEDIKRKLATGGFQADLDARRTENERAFASGEIDSQTYNRTKKELDTTTAQEQAAIAAEEVQRELDRQNAKLKVELDFADNIRKSLETAFLSPVELFQKELDKIRTNVELTDEEKALAEKDLRKNAREQLIGKTAVEQFSERERDIAQGQAAGLITDEEAANEIKKNADALASALGVPVNPANKMEVAVSELDAALKAGKISVEQHADGLKAAQRSFLEGLGIKTAAEDVDADKMNELRRQRDAKKITDEQFEQGRQAIENDIVGQSAADRIGEQRRRIEAGIANGTVDGSRGAAALRSLDADRRSAAGVDDSPAERLQLGIDKINDAFGTTGLTMEQIQDKLSPEEFAEYQKALGNNTDAVKASLGVEKSGAAKIEESRQRLDRALEDGVITAEERDKAIKKQRDSLLSSLGITKSPAQEFEDAVSAIKENASELSPDEIASGLKEAKEKLLSALGVEKSPADAAADSLKKLNEALASGAISMDEFNEGAEKVRDSLLQNLGIPLDPVNALRDRMVDLQDALSKGLITQEEFTKGQEEARRSMLPGGEAKSPVEQFREDMDAVGRALDAGLISKEEAGQRGLNLQAQLQEDLKPALDATAADRRLVGASDVRSKEGVDTFFRILQGRDNPSLKAQLEIARNTRLLAEAARDEDAAPVIAQLSAR